MSRSRRKSPFIGLTGHKRSEKDDKRRFNRKMRRINKTSLVNTQDTDALVLKHKDEVENVYSFNKDGKQRIDPDKFKKEMRK